jgi:hypothetical protein
MKELKEPSVTTTGSTQSYEFTLVEFESIIFECIALVVSLFAFTSYQLMQQTIAKLKDTSYREEVLLLQNYETMMTYNPEMEGIKGVDTDLAGSKKSLSKEDQEDEAK